MDRDDGVTRQDYGNKTGEGARGKSKELSSKSAQMTKGGTSESGSRGGPTGSERNYPKSKGVNMSADFNPMSDKKRSGTDWAVGGV